MKKILSIVLTLTVLSLGIFLLLTDASAATEGDGATTAVVVDPVQYPYPESAHDYGASTNETKTFTYPGAVSLSVTFSTQTNVESNYDYIYVFDGSEKQIAEYTGTAAAGITLEIPGDTFKIKLTSDSIIHKYGYSFDTIVANMPAPKHIATGNCSETVSWTLDEEGTLTVSGTGAMPDYYDDYAPWYDYQSQIVKVVVEDGITGIGARAFYRCAQVGTVDLADSVTSIGYYAFAECGRLTSVPLQEGIITIGNGAFNSCTALTEVVLPDSVTSIGQWAFMHCQKLETITLGRGVTSIGFQGLYGTISLESIIFDGTVAQWNAIEKGEYWNDRTGSYNVYCTDGRILSPLVESTISEAKAKIAAAKEKFQPIETSLARVNALITQHLSGCNASGCEIEQCAMEYEATCNNYSYFKERVKSIDAEICALENAQKINLQRVEELSTEIVYLYDRYVKVPYFEADIAAVNAAVSELHPYITGIAINTQPNKTAYITGESLDTTGLTLAVTYSDGSTQIISEDFAVSGFDANTLGTQTVTVTYAKFSQSFEIRVQCAQHSFTNYVYQNDATCTEDGTKVADCDYCDEISTIVAENTALGHKGNVWIQLLTPTCTEEGLQARICKVCAATETAPVEALGHSYGAVVTAPTCTDRGYTTHICANCGDSYVDSYVDATAGTEGHQWSAWVELISPTCAAEGTKVRFCNCGTKETETIATVPHTFENMCCTLCGMAASYNWTLTADTAVNVSLEQDLYVDLNGYDLSGTIVTNGHKIYGMDSTTNAFVCDTMGYFTCVDEKGNKIVPEALFSPEQDLRYVTIATDAGYTFHRYYLAITHVSLQPATTSFGYKAEFWGDALVQAQVTSQGYSLWVTENLVVSRSLDGFRNTMTLRLKNFDVENHGETPVYAKVSMYLADGTILDSATEAWSMRQMVELVDGQYDDLNQTQQANLQTMIKKHPVIKSWNIENILPVSESLRSDFTADKKQRKQL